MTLFNWHRIFRLSQGNVSKILTIMEYVILKEIPDSLYSDTIQLIDKDLSGESFLLNGDLLLNVRYKYSDRELVEYIALAARRNLADFMLKHTKTLDTLLVPNKLLSQCRHNRLLYEDSGKIHFLLEEVQTKRK